MLNWQLLLPLLRGGDANAWKTVVDKLHPSLLKCAYKFVKCHNTAEDVVQSALIYSRAGIQRGDQVTNPEGYFYRMTCLEAKKTFRDKHLKNKSLDTSQSKSDNDSNSWAANVKNDRAEDPRQNVEKQELRDAIRSAVCKLDPSHRVVIELRFFMGLSLGEIATRIGLSKPSGASARINRALLILRANLGDEFNDFESQSG